MKDALINILKECSDHIDAREYDKWYSADTMLSFEEYKGTYVKDLLDRV